MVIRLKRAEGVCKRKGKGGRVRGKGGEERRGKDGIGEEGKEKGGRVRGRGGE